MKSLYEYLQEEFKPPQNPVSVNAYHGSGRLFKKFSKAAARVSRDNYGNGAGYFTDDKKLAHKYAKPYMYHTTVSAKNLFDVDHMFSGEHLKHILPNDHEAFARGAGLMKVGVDRSQVINDLKSGKTHLTGLQVFKGLSKGGVETDKATDHLKSKGYDGLRYNAGEDMKSSVYIPYHEDAITIHKVTRLVKKPINESKDLYKDKLEGLKNIHGDVYVRHNINDEGRHVYTVHHQGNKIASAKLSGQDHYVTDVDVQPEFRRKGVATVLYNFIGKHSGKKLKPSPMYQTSDGKALWAKKQKTLAEKFAEYKINSYPGHNQDRGKVGLYDTDYFDKKHDILKDDKGKALGFRHVLFPKKEIKSFADDVIPKEDDVIHRGMSHAEYKNIIKTRKIKSNGSGNIGKEQEGLTYYGNPGEAGSYATSFAPSKKKPSPTKPGYIVSVKKPDDSQIKKVQGTGNDEVGVKGHISADDIVAVHRAKVVAYQPGEKVVGQSGHVIVRVSPSSHVHWEKIK